MGDGVTSGAIRRWRPGPRELIHSLYEFGVPEMEQEGQCDEAAPAHASGR
jgi:hypothetical protein